MNYQVWEKSVPPQIRGDAVWSLEAYRLSLFVADVGWHDANELAKHRRTIKMGGEMLEALGGVPAALARSVGRNVPGEAALAREEALASARAACGWYFQSRHVLGQEIIMHRVRILHFVMGWLKEQGAGSATTTTATSDETVVPKDKLEALLQTVPLP
jgi:hypothetical protein